MNAGSFSSTSSSLFKKIVTCVHRLHVLKLDGLAQHHLIERPDEESVQELPMVDCHS